MILCALVAASAAQAQEFSAQGIAHNNHGQVAQTKVFVENQNVRVEPVGGISYEILDTEKGVGYYIVPAKKIALKQNPEASKTNIDSYTIGNDVCAKISTKAIPATCTKLGVEAVNGRPADKWELVQDFHTSKLKSTIWVDRALRLIVRARSVAGSFDLVNIRLGKQPATLFVIPPDYKHTEMGWVTFKRVK